MIRVLFLTTFAIIAAPLHAAPPQLLRMAVVDESGSMEGDRSAVVRKELHALINQLPPSPRTPLAIVAFTESAQPARVFTSKDAAARFIEGLQGAAGGTNIASGLQQAAVDLKPYIKSSNVVLMLYTDGEDNNQAGIMKAEEQLNAIFSQRKKQGLSQSVFCKRWGNANAALVQRIRERGNATVIDAQDLSVYPATYSPTVTVTKVTRDSANPDHITLDITLAAPAKTSFSGPLPGIVFQCYDWPAITVPANGTKQVQQAFVVSDANKANGFVPLPYSIDLEPTQKDPKAPVLLSIVTKPKEAYVILNTLSLACELAGSCTWHDPLQRIVKVPVKFTLNVHGALHQHQATDYEFAVGNGVTVRGDKTVRIAGPGKHTFVREWLFADAKPDEDPFQLNFNLTPKTQQPFINFYPSTVPTSTPTISPPAAVTTTMSVRVLSVSEPQWIHLPTATAFVQSETELTITGPIRDNTQLILIHPAVITNARVNPRIVRTGVQTLCLQLAARMRPYPAKNNLDFTIAPPNLKGTAVRFAGEAAFRLLTVGPKPVPITVSNGNQAPLELFASDNEHSVTAHIVPVVPGIHPQVTGALSAKIAVPHQQKTLFSRFKFPLFKSTELEFPIPAGSRSFFSDTVLKYPLVVTPNQPSPAVVPTTTEVVVVVDAPFKRLAFYLTTSASIVVVIGAMAHMFGRLWKTS